MKKILAVFFLLALATFFSVQPRAMSHSTASVPVAKIIIPRAANGVEAAESVRNLAIRPMTECPVGYYDCDGCCVPYKCPDPGNGP